MKNILMSARSSPVHVSCAQPKNRPLQDQPLFGHTDWYTYLDRVYSNPLSAQTKVRPQATPPPLPAGPLDSVARSESFTSIADVVDSPKDSLHSQSSPSRLYKESVGNASLRMCKVQITSPLTSPSSEPRLLPSVRIASSPPAESLLCIFPPQTTKHESDGLYELTWTRLPCIFPFPPAEHKPTALNACVLPISTDLPKEYCWQISVQKAKDTKTTPLFFRVILKTPYESIEARFFGQFSFPKDLHTHWKTSRYAMLCDKSQKQSYFATLHFSPVTGSTQWAVIWNTSKAFSRLLSSIEDKIPIHPVIESSISQKHWGCCSCQ